MLPFEGYQSRLRKALGTGCVVTFGRNPDAVIGSALLVLGSIFTVASLAPSDSADHGEAYAGVLVGLLFGLTGFALVGRANRLRINLEDETWHLTRGYFPFWRQSRGSLREIAGLRVVPGTVQIQRRSVSTLDVAVIFKDETIAPYVIPELSIPIVEQGNENAYDAAAQVANRLRRPVLPQ